MTVICATGNRGKLIEIKQILEQGMDLDFNVISAADAGIHKEIEETGTTFLENAYIKAREIYRLVKDMDIVEAPYCVLADDSGLGVEALSGRPGVYSARYAGPHATDDENIRKLLEELREIPDNERQAAFLCAVAVVCDDGTELDATGRMSGVIAKSCKGKNGFGYDPVMYITAQGKMVAEMTAEEKNAISHRGRALAKIKIMLKHHWTKAGLL